MRTALETKQTNRARLRDILCGTAPRTASAIASADAIIAAWSLTAINTTTFGEGVEETRGGNDVCAITATDKTLTSADNPWTSADVGKIIHVAGAGTAGGTLVSRIASFTSAGEVELEDAAVTTVAPSVTSAAGLAIWFYPLNDVSGSAVLPTGSETWKRVDVALGNAGVETLTAAALTLSALYNRKILIANRGTAQEITLHKTAPVGFAILVEQIGAGAVTFAAEAGATLQNRQSHDGIAGQYGAVTLFVRANADDESAIWTLVGDTA